MMLAPLELQFDGAGLSLREKLLSISWIFILLILAVGGIGLMTLYSAADGSVEPWAMRQGLRFILGLAAMLTVAVVDIRLWLRWAYIIYGIALVLLVAVEIHGSIGLGAQRWIDLGFLQIQPSEIMKIALVLALARYFHGIGWTEIGRPVALLPAAGLIAVPAALVLKQPDVGTAMMLLLAGAAIFFLAGMRVWQIGIVAGVFGAALPLAWRLMRDYQRQRILVFLHPESDPLGAGYHILQSKIALGSGGMFGKGFMMGTQSHLDFLPEKQTDFIFTMLAEEWGMVGGLVLLSLYALIIVWGFAMSLRSRSQFGRLLGLGVTATFFLYVFINIAMVMGVVPVVGVPLPLISYGGTAMLTLLIGFGLILNVNVHRDVPLGRGGGGEEW